MINFKVITLRCFMDSGALLEYVVFTLIRGTGNENFGKMVQLAFGIFCSVAVRFICSFCTRGQLLILAVRVGFSAGSS